MLLEPGVDGVLFGREVLLAVALVEDLELGAVVEVDRLAYAVTLVPDLVEVVELAGIGEGVVVVDGGGARLHPEGADHDVHHQVDLTQVRHADLAVEGIQAHEVVVPADEVAVGDVHGRDAAVVLDDALLAGGVLVADCPVDGADVERSRIGRLALEKDGTLPEFWHQVEDVGFDGGSLLLAEAGQAGEDRRQR